MNRRLCSVGRPCKARAGAKQNTNVEMVVAIRTDTNSSAAVDARLQFLTNQHPQTRPSKAARYVYCTRTYRNKCILAQTLETGHCSNPRTTQKRTPYTCRTTL